jgi:hypothetical protein
MVGYLILALFAVAVVWFLVHLRRTPPMPARRPFEADHDASLTGSPREPRDPTAYSQKGTGDFSGGPGAL